MLKQVAYNEPLLEIKKLKFWDIVIFVKYSNINVQTA